MVSISDGVEKFCLLSCIKVQKSTKPASKIFPHRQKLKSLVSIPSRKNSWGYGGGGARFLVFAFACTLTCVDIGLFKSLSFAVKYLAKRGVFGAELERIRVRENVGRRGSCCSASKRTDRSWRTRGNSSREVFRLK